MITRYHAKYYAWEITRRRRGGDVDRISQSLFDASVDLNPHQIEAALFALQNPLSKGVILADEVGLGKTIEAALVLCQYWAERRRRLLVICPAALRKQWANELAEKFNLPAQVQDAASWNKDKKSGIYNPLDQDVIPVISFNFAVRIEQELRQIPWDAAVIDEAHKLRNAHRESHRSGQTIKRALAGSRKILLTATPLQNSLLELYGLSTVIDEHIFGDSVSFRTQFMRNGGDISGLRERLDYFIKRTLRRQVLEYIQYTERKALTVPFTPSDDEQRLYDLVSGYLQRDDTYGFPRRQRHLISLILRKLMASSTEAVTGTLEVILDRLKLLLEEQELEDENWIERLIAAEDIETDFIEEDEDHAELSNEKEEIDLVKLRGEIAEIDQYILFARSIHRDEKSNALLTALQVGFERMAEMGAARKAVIFTESRRTQDYLARVLEQEGYSGKVVRFSGSNSSLNEVGIYKRWLKKYAGSDRITGSLAVDRRTALIDYFREQGEIMIATEAGAEGINLQFCSLVINYDLPWNPQRVEQRIGRCHRYGQKFDVVVINFLNQRNEADRRVLDLLSEKFHLFDGVFGASDHVLGRIESGVDFEQQIAEIYATCRTAQEIEQAFRRLRQKLETNIAQRMQETEKKLLENFDAQIHDLLKIRHKKAVQSLDHIEHLFWSLTRFILAHNAAFDDTSLSFKLEASPCKDVPDGKYQLIQKGSETPQHAHLYRLSHPLGQYVLDIGRRQDTPLAQITFMLSTYAYKVSVLDNLESKSGWLELNLLELHSFDIEEHLVFSALSDSGENLDQEACEALFKLDGGEDLLPLQTTVPQELDHLAQRHIEVALNRALNQNDEHFRREREKLEQWADDQLAAAEQLLEDTKNRLRDAKRRARLAETVAEQKTIQEEIKKLERQQRRQRQNVFDVEDQIEEKRDQLINALEARMKRKTHTHRLLRIRWVLA